MQQQCEGIISLVLFIGYLLMCKHHVYDTLFSAFPKLYEELSIDPRELLTPSQVFHFVPPNIFIDTLAKDYLTNLFTYAQEYAAEVLKNY